MPGVSRRTSPRARAEQTFTKGRWKGSAQCARIRAFPVIRLAKFRLRNHAERCMPMHQVNRRQTQGNSVSAKPTTMTHPEL